MSHTLTRCGRNYGAAGERVHPACWQRLRGTLLTSATRSSSGPPQPSATADTCSLSIRKKSTAPGVQGRPSADTRGSAPKSPWGRAGRWRARLWSVRVRVSSMAGLSGWLGSHPCSRPPPTSHAPLTSTRLSSQVCSFSAMRATYLPMSIADPLLAPSAGKGEVGVESGRARPRRGPAQCTSPPGPGESRASAQQQRRIAARRPAAGAHLGRRCGRRRRPGQPARLDRL